MITLFCIFLIIACLVAFVKIFAWFLAAAFRLIPFLFGLGFAILIIGIAAYLLGIIGAVVAIVVLIGLCLGKHHAG
ncbi:MAG: hypothetical protein PUG16_00960 [Lachnospiraceae bacterium]|jgi:hypothetical protein|nr:hypothetical protein [Lachnospiraceae bacterium]